MKISSDASQRYQAKNKRSLTHGTPGGLIQLLDFEIVATHLGPRPERVTIDVNDFKSLGSNGSGNFGFATPYSVESRLEIKQLLLSLENIRHRNSQGDHLSPNSSIRSQFSTASSVEEPDSVSQAVFATQTPFAATPAARRPNLPVAGKQSRSSFPTGTDDRDTATHSNGGLSKSGAPKNSLADSEHIHSGRPTVNGKKDISQASAALLGLVQQAAQPMAKVKPVLPATNRIPTAVPNVEDKVTVTGGQAGIGNAKPPPVAFTVPSQDLQFNEAATTLPEAAAKYDLSQPAMTSEHIQHPIRNRISNRDVRIPKDQALLLDSEDCELSKHKNSIGQSTYLSEANRSSSLATRITWPPSASSKHSHLYIGFAESRS